MAETITWDWKEQLPLDELASAVHRASGGTVVVAEVDTGGDEYQIEITGAGAADEIEDDCPHCSPSHEGPERCSWSVRIGPDRDGDGQPVSLIVQPTDGAHVAPADVRWLWELIRLQAEPDRPNVSVGDDGPRLPARPVRHAGVVIDHGQGMTNLVATSHGLTTFDEAVSRINRAFEPIRQAAADGLVQMARHMEAARQESLSQERYGEADRG